MLIIVEGPDGAGKTTFVERLRDRIEYHHRGAVVETFHARPPKNHPLDEYERPLLGYRQWCGRHIICDRWHWGESVYPHVLRRPTQYDLPVRRHVELFLRSRGAVVAYLNTPWEMASARIAVRGDDYIHPSQLRWLKHEYDNVARRTLLPVRKVPPDFNTDDIDSVIDTAQYSERLTRCLNAFTTYVGSTDPEVLLLGDIRHELRRGHRPDPGFDDRQPAFGPLPATSGYYLLKHLRTIRRLGLANACDVDNWERLWRTLGQPRVVTLGVEATRRVDRMDFGTAPHPQYVRRFHHAHGAEYARVIERAKEGKRLLSWRP